MGQSWWNCEGGVWGRFGGFVKTMCRDSWWNCEGCVLRQSWWKCESSVWGRFGGIVKVECGADLVEL